MASQTRIETIEPPELTHSHVEPLLERIEKSFKVAEVPQRTVPKPRRQRQTWPWVGALLLLLVAIAGGLYLWRGTGSGAPAYLTVEVERGNIEDSTIATGTLQPFDFVDVGTQVSGQLRSIHVEVGNEVREGDLLAEIDPTIYRSRVEGTKAELLALKAQLADRQAQLVLAGQQLERQRQLMAARATSEQALQSAVASHKSAAAQVTALKAQIQNTESTLNGEVASLGYTVIRAPMAGTVVSLSAKQGQTLNANQQAPVILRIANLSTMTVTAQVSEADIGRLENGMDVYFTTLGRPDRKWRGQLRKILPTPSVVNNVVLYSALFDVPNPNRQLMTQMTAQVFFVSARAEDALLVPLGALQPLGGKQPRDVAGESGADVRRYKVQVQQSDGTLDERIVTVGVTNRVDAQIVEGLAEGDRVVIGRSRSAGSADRSAAVRLPRLS
ncbi:MAG: efflux RND transporter periplasmic adaptor subunit [Kiloniellales bacterium]